MNLWARQKGLSLLETVISLALLGILLPALMVVSTALVTGSRRADERATLARLAQAQIEDIFRQPFQEDPGTYTLLPPCSPDVQGLVTCVPPGYSVAVAVTTPLRYGFANGTLLPPEIQEVTVTVTSSLGKSSQLSRFKVKR